MNRSRAPLLTHSGGESACNEALSQCSRSVATLRLRHFIAARFIRHNELIKVLSKKFFCAEQGVALIEFALLFPFFFLLLFGGIEMTRLLVIQQRLERAGYVLADITTQYLPATKAQAASEINETMLRDNVFPQLTRIMVPYQDSKRQAIILTSVKKEGGSAKVMWQIASKVDSLTGCDTMAPKNCVVSVVDGLSPGAITPAVVGRPTSFPPEFDAQVQAMPDQENIIVSEVFYYYQPILDTLLVGVGKAGGAGAMGFNFFVPARIYVKRTFFAPRNGAMFYLPPSFPAPTP